MAVDNKLRSSTKRSLGMLPWSSGYTWSLSNALNRALLKNTCTEKEAQESMDTGAVAMCACREGGGASHDPCSAQHCYAGQGLVRFDLSELAQLSSLFFPCIQPMGHTHQIPCQLSCTDDLGRLQPLAPIVVVMWKKSPEVVGFSTLCPSSCGFVIFTLF